MRTLLNTSGQCRRSFGSLAQVQTLKPNLWANYRKSGKDLSLFREQAYINGEWRDGKDQFEVRDPATDEVLGKMADLGIEETREAIDAAEKAFPAWSSKPAAERSSVLKKMFDLMNQNSEQLAHIMTAECGKPLVESRGEVVYGASFLEWFAEEAKRVYGDIIPSKNPSQRILTLKQPIGVTAMITPWNFPNAMIARKLGPCLAAGCTAIIRPSGETPYSAVAFAELAERVGIPKGVVNIIPSRPGSYETGNEICENPTIRKVSFTGSTGVGKQLAKICAGTVKRMSLELGGNAPFIVFDDADIDAAVEGAIASKFRNAGQTCVCANRFFVQEGVFDEFVSKFTRRVSQFRLGHGFQDGVQIGPLISKKGKSDVLGIVDEAVVDGGELVCGSTESFNNFVEPCIIVNANVEMRACREEIFGPVAPILKFSSDDEVIKMANDVPVGLASYFYARDLSRVWRMSEQLEYGMVGINTGIISTEVAPFGGVKESGIGREGSKYGLDEYTQLKYMMMGGI